MELVYLWVEDYKNIHRQGFNFSPRFDCTFHDEYDVNDKLNDDCKLEIFEKKEDEYIEDFFGKNINMTAIVGKNGSGKSNLLDFLWIIILKEFSSESKYILLYKINTKNDICMLTNISTMANKSCQPFSFNLISHPDDKNRYVELINNLLVLRKKDNFISNISFIYIPKKVKIKFDPDATLNANILHYMDKDYYIDSFEYGNIGRPTPDKDKDLFENQLQALDIRKKIILCKKINQSEEKSKIKLFFEELKGEMSPKIQKEYDDLKDIQDDIFIEITESTIDIINLVNEYSELEFINNRGVHFNSLSSGEQHYSLLFLKAYSEIIKNKSSSIVYTIDESEIFLHPNWQKKLIKDFKLVFSKCNKKIHFIFTTHSPFLLSDIPKQNIIFLDTYENGKCKVLTNDEVLSKKQTFGANIHTLLSDSFFMDGGLMGEFAKGKIDEAIKLLNQDKLDETELKYCEQIISIIGEPIVKNQLQRMLDSKRLKKIDEIDKLYEEIELIKHRIEIMRKND